MPETDKVKQSAVVRFSRPFVETFADVLGASFVLGFFGFQL